MRRNATRPTLGFAFRRLHPTSIATTFHTATSWFDRPIRMDSTVATTVPAARHELDAKIHRAVEKLLVRRDDD